MRIVKYPHPTLRHKSRDLKRVDVELRKAIAEMFELMYENRGIGLAANQVDLPYRIFILNVSGEAAAKDQEHVLINPTILKWSGGIEADEGMDAAVHARDLVEAGLGGLARGDFAAGQLGREFGERELVQHVGSRTNLFDDLRHHE